MGTWCVVEAAGSTVDREASAVNAAFAVIERIALRMHPAHAQSDVAAINRARIGQPIPIDAELQHVLNFARDLNLSTAGAFDPCLPDQPGRSSDLVLEGSYVTTRARLALDLGGIAKGFAIDRAIDELRRAGCMSGQVTIGGDLRVFGEPQTIAVRLPEGALRELSLSEKALAVSEVDHRERPEEHRGYYSRSKSRSLLFGFAAVSAPEAMIADALTKCALICSDDEMAEVAGRWGAEWMRV
jgi:FAD:protein FMN transferase